VVGQERRVFFLAAEEGLPVGRGQVGVFLVGPPRRAELGVGSGRQRVATITNLFLQIPDFVF
jgi:hypothetical protein